MVAVAVKKFLMKPNHKRISRHVDVEIFEKVNPEIYEEMTFDARCERIKKKKLVASKNDESFKNLLYLCQLRNRVHVHILKDDTDTDYLQDQSKRI